MRTRIGIRSTVGLMLLLSGFADHLIAGTWPQILGPSRTGVAEDEKVADSWPAGGPQAVWKIDVGSGFAGPAVSEDRVVLFHRKGPSEIVQAFSVADGKSLWDRSFPTRYVSSIAPDDGPRCVPLIHGDLVFAMGAGGDLHCVSLTDGKEFWSRSLYKDYKTLEGYFGAGSSPIVLGDRLLVNVGGRGGAGIVALALKTGETTWKATDEDASYSSPIAATVNGKELAIFVTRYNAVGIDPANGEIQFRYPFGQRGPTVNAASPLMIDGKLFLSASYGVGAVLLELSSGSAKPVWKNDESMSSQYTTCMLHDGYLYGIHGRQDVGVAELRCIDPKSGKVLWTEAGFGTGNLILAGDKLVIVKTDGTLILARPSPKKFEKLAEAQVLETTAQPLPALADGKLYVRDTTTLKCFDLRGN